MTTETAPGANYRFFDRETDLEISEQEWLATAGEAPPIASTVTPAGLLLTFWKGLTHRDGTSPSVYSSFIHRGEGEHEMLAGYMTREEAERGHERLVAGLNG